jgi:RNA-binding protein
MANNFDPILNIGKYGIDDNVIKQIEDLLEARELIKISVLKNSLIEVREACNKFCEATGADPVQVIGNRFVIYKPSINKPTIQLP